MIGGTRWYSSKRVDRMASYLMYNTKKQDANYIALYTYICIQQLQFVILRILVLSTVVYRLADKLAIV